MQVNGHGYSCSHLKDVGSSLSYMNILYINATTAWYKPSRICPSQQAWQLGPCR